MIYFVIQQHCGISCLEQTLSTLSVFLLSTCSLSPDIVLCYVDSLPPRLVDLVQLEVLLQPLVKRCDVCCGDKAIVVITKEHHEQLVVCGLSSDCQGAELSL